MLDFLSIRRNQWVLFILFIALCFAFSTLSILVAQEDHDGHGGEIERESPIPLNPALGGEIGFIYETFLSPHQVGGEEEDAPFFIPAEVRSTRPSTPRNERTSRGHMVIEFTNDLSRAYVYLAVENVNPEDVVMMHLHCGLPGQLGPILVDFSLVGALPDLLADSVMTVEVTNDLIVESAAHDTGIVGLLTAGCPIMPDNPNKIVTVAGMESLAREGKLYINVHTYAQTYFGDIRGQFHLMVN